MPHAPRYSLIDAECSTAGLRDDDTGGGDGCALAASRDALDAIEPGFLAGRDKHAAFMASDALGTAKQSAPPASGAAAAKKKLDAAAAYLAAKRTKKSAPPAAAQQKLEAAAAYLAAKKKKDAAPAPAADVAAASSSSDDEGEWVEMDCPCSDFDG